MIRLMEQGTQLGCENDFELAVAFLLQSDPQKKKRGGGNKRTQAQISAASGGNQGGDKGKGDKGVSFKPAFGKTGVELRYYKKHEWKNLTKEQQTELLEHRKKNGNYRGAWTGKSPTRNNSDKNDRSPTLVNKATISAMIAEHESKRRKEVEEKESLKQGLMEDLNGMINSQIAAVFANGVGGNARKTLQKAGANVAISGVDSEPAQISNAAERCAASLMARFNAMGSKAGKKTG